MQFRATGPVTAMCIVLSFAGSAVQAACDRSTGAVEQTEVISCGGALTLERERSAALTIAARPGDEPPSRIELEGGAILITVEPGSRDTRIITPHAIAAVRGTTYVVDAGADSTSVFVLKGAVDVRKSGDDGTTVTLGPGEGSDVTADTDLTASTWPAERIDALLSRFGR